MRLFILFLCANETQRNYKFTNERGVTYRYQGLWRTMRRIWHQLYKEEVALRLFRSKRILYKGLNDENLISEEIEYFVMNDSSLTSRITMKVQRVWNKGLVWLGAVS